MTALELRTEIIQLLGEEHNTRILEAIKLLLRRDDADGTEDFTEEELAELEAQRAAHLRGETKSYTVEESMRMIRSGFKK